MSLQKIIMSVDKDKVIHFAVCLLIALVAGAVAHGVFRLDAVYSMGIAWAVGLAAGMAKELYDEWKYSGADSADLAADVLGTTIGTVLVYFLVL